MSQYRGIFIIVAAATALSAFLAYQPRPAVAVQETLSQALAATDPVGFKSIVEVWQDLTVSAPTSPSAPKINQKPEEPARIIRVPAIRDASNYGWVQLPRGAQVDFVEAQGDGVLIRYDESYTVVPRAAIEDGTVVLRKRQGNPVVSL